MQRSIIIALLSAHVFVFLALTLAYSNPAAPGVVSPARQVSLLPFRSIARDVRQGGDALRVNIVGNVVVMLPLGVATLALGGGRARVWHAALPGFLLSVAVESLQFRTGRRVADVDDVALNTLGAVLGFLFASAVRRAFRRGGPPTLAHS